MIFFCYHYWCKRIVELYDLMILMSERAKRCHHGVYKGQLTIWEGELGVIFLSFGNWKHPDINEKVAEIITFKCNHFDCVEALIVALSIRHGVCCNILWELWSLFLTETLSLPNCHCLNMKTCVRTHTKCPHRSLFHEFQTPQICHWKSLPNVVSDWELPELIVSRQPRSQAEGNLFNRKWMSLFSSRHCARNEERQVKYLMEASLWGYL